MSLFDATFGQDSHDSAPPEIENVHWVPFVLHFIPGGCKLSLSGAAPAWISREAVGPILRRMEKVKERDLTLRSMALLGSCCLCGLPLYFLASLERKNQKRMRELLEELKSTIVASGGAGVRFVSMLRRYQGPDEVYKYEDKWLGFARTEEAVDRLNDLPTNWLPYATSRVFKNINRLEVRDRVY